MRTLRAAGLPALFALTCASWLHAQSGQPVAQPPAPAQPNGSVRPIQEGGPREGGTREFLQSIVIPPMVEAPFTLTLQTEWVRNFADGSSQTLVNHRRIARDANGRVYQERQRFAPKGGDQESMLTFIQITDPNLHQFYDCSVATKICELSRYTTQSLKSYQPVLAPAGRPNGSPREVARDDLGTDTILGVQTNGIRETTTIDAGAVGNDRAIVTTREFWFSPKLGINLISKHSDSRYGAQTFTVSEIDEAEPDATLFQPPQGFQIRELKKVPEPSE